MANLKEISRKIKSVKNTQKTTRAMKLVSTAKLRKAELAAKRSREYAVKLNEVMSEISYKIHTYKDVASSSRYFHQLDEKVVDMIFITADKGLCGGFNHQTIKAVSKLIEEYKSKDKSIKIRLRAVGRKGIDYFKFQGIELLEEYINVSSSPDQEKSLEVIDAAIKDFDEGKTDKVILIHNGYKNMITKELKKTTLLPIDEIEYDGAKDSMLEVEPNDEEEEVLNELIQKYVEYNMYYSLIDSLAAEHSARMQAMDAATNNAAERAYQLKLEFNKARQESITTELIEIISGVESLK
jgi:F-type H+-transporting ATPase subunit gamma